MKKILGAFVILSYAFSLFTIAQGSWESKYGSDPIKILDTVVGEANEEYQIQQTSLDDAASQGAYSSQYKIANTLDRFRNNINPYLQWTVYIGLSIAVILLIYNGFLMVTNVVHKQGDISKIKTNIINIVIGVIILTGFYFIIKLAVSIINSLFGGYGGDTGF